MAASFTRQLGRQAGIQLISMGGRGNFVASPSPTPDPDPEPEVIAGFWSEDLSSFGTVFSSGFTFHNQDPFEAKTVIGTAAASSGRYYFEIGVSGQASGDLTLSGGLVEAETIAPEGPVMPGNGSTAQFHGQNLIAPHFTGPDENSPGAQTIMVAFDAEAGEVWFGADGLWRVADGGFPNNIIDTGEVFVGGFIYREPGPLNEGVATALTGALSPYVSGVRSRLGMSSAQQIYQVPNGFQSWGDAGVLPLPPARGEVYVRAKKRSPTYSNGGDQKSRSGFADNYGSNSNINGPSGDFELIHDVPLSTSAVNEFGFEVGPLRFRSSDNPIVEMSLALDADFGVAPYVFGFDVVHTSLPTLQDNTGTLSSPQTTIDLGTNAEPGMLSVRYTPTFDLDYYPEDFGVDLVNGFYLASIRITDSEGEFRIVQIKISVRANTDYFGKIPSGFRCVDPMSQYQDEPAFEQKVQRYARCFQVPWNGNYDFERSAGQNHPTPDFGDAPWTVAGEVETYAPSLQALVDALADAPCYKIGDVVGFGELAAFRVPTTHFYGPYLNGSGGGIVGTSRLRDYYVARFDWTAASDDAPVFEILDGVVGQTIQAIGKVLIISVPRPYQAPYFVDVPANSFANIHFSVSFQTGNADSSATFNAVATLEYRTAPPFEGAEEVAALFPYTEDTLGDLELAEAIYVNRTAYGTDSGGFPVENAFHLTKEVTITGVGLGGFTAKTLPIIDTFDYGNNNWEMRWLEREFYVTLPALADGVEVFFAIPYESGPASIFDSPSRLRRLFLTVYAHGSQQIKFLPGPISGDDFSQFVANTFIDVGETGFWAIKAKSSDNAVAVTAEWIADPMPS